MLRNKTVHQATQHGAWYLWSMIRQKHLFSEHWHVTYTVTFLFTQGRRCFPNIWIQSGSTMWLCDELLTIVMLELVNRFVHGRVPSPVHLMSAHFFLNCEGYISFWPQQHFQYRFIVWIKKQCVSWSAGFWWSQLIWVHTVFIWFKILRSYLIRKTY